MPHRYYVDEWQFRCNSSLRNSAYRGEVILSPVDILIRRTASNLTASSFSFFLPADGLINPVTFLHAALTQDVTVRPFVPGFHPSFFLIRSTIRPPSFRKGFLSPGKSTPLFLNTDRSLSTAKLSGRGIFLGAFLRYERSCSTSNSCKPAISKLIALQHSMFRCQSCERKEPREVRATK